MGTSKQLEYSAIIVDDAPQARKLLRLMLAEVSGNIVIVAEAENAAEAHMLIKQHQPELLFLDIEMPGKSGLQLLEDLASEKQPSETIFVTAYNQYAIQAFKLSAVGYLLKPFRKKDLGAAVANAQEQIRLKKSEKHLNVLLNNLKQNEAQTLSLTVNYGYEYLPLNNIEYLEADGAYTNFHLVKGKNILVSKNLKHYENILCPLDTFAKVNRSYIVNMHCVKAYRKEERGIVVMQSGAGLKLSPNCAEDFFKKRTSFSI